MSRREICFEVVDTVHGKITFPSYVKTIVDTEIFQRLKNIRQLGNSRYVYPGMNHTRFEHCLGVAHLVQTFLAILERNCNRCIDESLKKYVTIAGLLHDLGHGPFSHMWERFVHRATGMPWRHEEISCVLVEKIFQQIPLSDCPEEHARGVELIKALITGNSSKLKKLLHKEEMFISEIVSNPFCEVDVDKWDYILRDLFYSKNVIEIPIDFFAFFQRAKISHDKDGVSHVVYHVNDLSNILRLFEVRSRLHREIYQLPLIALTEAFVTDILLSAEKNGFTVGGVKMSNAHQHPEVYLLLDDSILTMIEISDDNQNLSETKKLISRLKQRKFYREIKSDEGMNGTSHIAGEIVQRIDLPRVPRMLPVYVDNDKDFFQPFLGESSVMTKIISYK